MSYGGLAKLLLLGGEIANVAQYPGRVCKEYHTKNQTESGTIADY